MNKQNINNEMNHIDHSTRVVFLTRWRISLTINQVKLSNRDISDIGNIWSQVSKRDSVGINLRLNLLNGKL